MKTKNIFKALAFAMLMPAMLFTTACSSDDDAVNNGINNNGKGYPLPVTINVSRQGEGTRATYDDVEKELSFSTGDKLFVKGTDGTAGAFAGTLEWTSDETFSGTLYTENAYSGTAVALLGSASTATATLLPAGYGSIGYLSVSGEGYSATLATDATKAFATSKANAVAQLSLEQASTYDDGFELAPQNAILNFKVTGLTVGTPSTVSFTAGSTTISGSVTPVEVDYRATATFAMAVAHSATASSLTLTVDGTAVSLGSHTLTAGKIYSQKLNNINGASPYIQDNEKWIVYGTGEPSGWRLSVAEGATVTLSNVYLNQYAIIACYGSNTIILADGTTNKVTPVSDTAITYMGGNGTTLTIKGTGTLDARGGYGGEAYPAIGPVMGGSCGNITIESTVHLTATAGDNNTKAITTNGGGTVTIGGVVYDGGADSPFEYPIPAPSYTTAANAASGDVGKLICTDGHIHAYGEDAECTATRVAKIIYVGNNTDNTTYTNGLALALDEEIPSDWSTAVSACAAKNTSTPVDGAYWMLPSRPQWEAMGATDGSSTKATLREGFSGVGGTNMQPNVYWSSTETADESHEYVHFYYFGDAEIYWLECNKKECGIPTRACLVF